MVGDVTSMQFLADELKNYKVEIAARSLGGLFLSWGKHSPAEYQRAQGQVRRDGLDDIVFFYSTGGHAACDFNGDYERVWGGLLYAVERNKPYTLHVPVEHGVINMSVPRELLEALRLDLNNIHGRIFRGSVADFIGRQMQLITMIESDNNHLSDAMIHMIAALFDERGMEIEKARSTDLKQRTMAWIDGSIGELSIDIDDLVRKMGLSRASLYRLFASDGGVQAYIRNRKLELARQRLLKGERITSVAYDLGFSSSAHFSTSFRKLYGASPREVQKNDTAVQIIIPSNAQDRVKRWNSLMGTSGDRPKPRLLINSETPANLFETPMKDRVPLKA